MSTTEPLGVGVIGLGFMGATHVRAFEDARKAGLPCRLVAVCDPKAERRAGQPGPRGNTLAGQPDQRLFDPTQVAGHAQVADLLGDEQVDLVSICTPTPSHVDLARGALQAGKHVLLEKPVALTCPEIERLMATATASGRVCMPAMCMRFWPGWSWLLERVQAGDLGQIQSASFRRLGSVPAWSRGFYQDPALSGGALMDLHIHDADLVRWLFGDPDSVQSTGSINHVTTLYSYAAGPAHVVAEGGWGHDPAFPFQMGFVVVFEGGTADFQLGRQDPLMLARDGVRASVPLAAGDGYDGEVRHLVTCLASGQTPEVSLDDALAVTRLLDRERQSLGRDTGS